jgi:hypothetical protein
MANDSSKKKELRAVSFVIHATRGLIRNHKTRRKAMFVLLIIAMLLLFAGATFLQSPLNPHEHPFGFILFWLACAWLTLTAMLLAIFDMLVVRLEARRAERTLREALKKESPESTTIE